MEKPLSSKVKFIATCSFSRLNVVITSRKIDLKLPQTLISTSSSVWQRDKQFVVSLSYPSTNKAFQVSVDSPCLKSFLYGKHELLAPVDIFPCPKPCAQARIHLVELVFLDLVIQCFINLLQSVVAKLVDLIEAHDHLNPISIPKCDGFWRVNYGE
ncbi:hypothetical protein Tco_1479668, partial [Tanacetum coccineum]